MKELFRPLTDEEKKVLKVHFKNMAKDLRALRDHYEKRRIDTFTRDVDGEDT